MQCSYSIISIQHNKSVQNISSFLFERRISKHSLLVKKRENGSERDREGKEKENEREKAKDRRARMRMRRKGREREQATGEK